MSGGGRDHWNPFSPLSPLNLRDEHEEMIIAVSISREDASFPPSPKVSLTLQLSWKRWGNWLGKRPVRPARNHAGCVRPRGGAWPAFTYCFS